MVICDSVQPKRIIKPPVNKGPKRKPGGRIALSQCLDMQEYVFLTSGIVREDAVNGITCEERARAASALASLCKAWEALDDRRRILRGQPLPGSLRPMADTKKPKAASLPT